MAKVDTQSFEELVETFNVEVEKFNEKGNASAGTRARKALMEISKLCKTLRADIQTAKNED